MENKQENNKRIAKNTFYLYIRQFIIMLVALYTTRIVLRVLGVVDYGIYNVVGGMVAMFSFLSSSLAQAAQRFIAFGIEKESIEEQNNNFSMLLNVHFIISIIAVLLCETIGLWLFYNKLVIPEDKIISAFWVMQCSIISLLITITQVPYNAAILGHEKMGIYAYISFMDVMLKLSVVFLIEYFFKDKLLAYGILIMLVHILIALLYRVYCNIKFKICKYRLYWSNKIFKELFNFSSWSIIGNTAMTLNNYGINFLINIFFGPIYNAARGISDAITNAILSFTTNFLAAIIPPIIKSYAKGDFKYCLDLNFQSGKLGFFIFMLLSLPIISCIDFILNIWLVEVPPSTSVFCILSLIYLQTKTFGGTIQNVVQATGKIKYYQLSYGLINLSALPIIYILYKLHSTINTYLYVLIFISICSVGGQLWSVKKVFPIFPIKKYLKEVILVETKTFCIPLILSLIIWNYIKLNLVTAIMYSFTIFIISIIFIWTIGYTDKERKSILCYIKQKRTKLRLNNNE